MKIDIDEVRITNKDKSQIWLTKYSHFASVAEDRETLLATIQSIINGVKYTKEELQDLIRGIDE